MARSLSNSPVFNIYSNKSRLTWVVLLVSAVISIASIYYTNQLVDQLKDREQRQVELFAKTLEYSAKETVQSEINFITQEILFQNNSIPTILLAQNGDIIFYRNIDIDSSASESRINSILRSELEEMKDTYDPILIELRDESTEELYGLQYVYYKNSWLLTQLTYYPYIQISVIAIFGFIAYMAFNYSKTAEQNRVWVGLAKETAHQLGTPISSLIAWIEFFKTDPKYNDQNIIEELEKDIKKLELITERFSSIGSAPSLSEENIVDVVRSTIGYLRNRISSKVKIRVKARSRDTVAKINVPLFEWVIENICKNAVDAMSGEGTLSVKIIEGSDYRVFIDITDTGKGIPKSKVNQVFQPGFTTKQRGWGLGLTLAKRIIENYHKGKIYIRTSEPDRGTTFRIVLKRKNPAMAA